MTGRLRGVDVARALALIGMMGTHLLPQYRPDDRVSGFFLVAAGRSSALFAVLAGVGLALATGADGRRPDHPAATVTRVAVRAALISGCGMSLVLLDPPIAVILTSYGLLFLLAVPLLWWPPRPLLMLAAGWVLVVPLVCQAWRSHLPRGPGAQPTFADLADPIGLLTRLALTGYYPVLTWLAYLMVGLAVGRLPLRRTATGVRLLVGGTLTAATSWLVSSVLVSGPGWPRLTAAGPAEVVAPALGPGQLQLRGLYGSTPTTSWWWQGVLSPHSGTPFDVAQTAGSAVAVLGGSLIALASLEPRIAGPRGWLPRGLLNALACAGSMPLTLYCLHVLAADERPAVSPRGLLIAHVAVALLVAPLWLRWRSRGPLEGVVHTLSGAAGRLAGPAHQPVPTSETR